MLLFVSRKTFYLLSVRCLVTIWFALPNKKILTWKVLLDFIYLLGNFNYLFQVSKRDKMTTMVCNSCIIRLDTWFSYKKQCHRNQTKLLEWLNISKINTPPESGESVSSFTFFWSAFNYKSFYIFQGVHIKQEPLDNSHPEGILPVKVEITYNEDEQFNGDMELDNTRNLTYEEDDMDLETMETEGKNYFPM